MQSDYPFVMREYAEAHTLTLVLCRPDGERKRSVRVLRKSSMIYKDPHGFCVLLSPHRFGQRPLVLRSLREKYLPDSNNKF